ncbi:hypothetical protein AWB67_02285 [Caballeronia terrestris]|uniref:TIR domain-containing protein n=1 Tax=Caballeronia terrestris TaxID=1226301 RepID=A0A158I034_9BURK|nr:toll/interleukin-1 receptor domain-containing protein [Caballeronia terrestris]SAL49906.1 hypothetical protein AWB67_02285 [Caballeronia terrestris]
MKEIGRADLVVVVLSEKYLRSIYCMKEMLFLFQQSLGDREHLMRKLVPLRAGELPISGAKDRLKIVRYWKDEHDELEAALTGLDPACIGQEDREEHLVLKDFQHRVGDILAWIADTVMPLSERRIDAVIDLLHQRARQLFDGSG